MDIVRQELLHAIDQNRMTHAYLFSGSTLSHQKEVVSFMIKALLCENRQEKALPCEGCAICQKINHQHFVDWITIQPDGQTIKVDQIRDLKRELAHSGVESAEKFATIEAADLMTHSASNSLLKLLEEPENNRYIFLLANQLTKILPTIQSRCQLIYLQNPSKESIVKQLVEEGFHETLVRYLLQLNRDLSTIRGWANDESILAMKQTSWTWFQQLWKDPRQAFIGVQTDLMPLVSNAKMHEQLLLDTLIFYCRDMMFMSQELGKNQLIFPENQPQYHSINRFNTKNWIHAIEQLYVIQNQAQSYIGLQGLLECFVLNIKKLQHEGK